MTLTEQIAAVLAEHVGSATEFCVACDWVPTRAEIDGNVEREAQRRHVAAHLAPLVRQAQAEALREAADAVENDETGASPSIRSLVGSIDGALKVEAWLRARADRIEAEA